MHLSRARVGGRPKLKLLLVMQLTAILLTVCCLTATAKVASQTVTYSGNDVPLKQLFSVIKDQTGVAVFYDEGLLKNTSPVDVHAKETPLLKFLQTILNNQPLTYTIKGETIFISAKEEKEKKKSTNDAPPITGIIRDADGNPIEGASVTIKGTNRGTKTDANGMFSIEASEGETLLISSIGFADRLIKVSPGKSVIEVLEKEEESLQQVTINKGYYTEKQRFTVGNSATVKAKDIEKQPVNNPLLAIQGRVPGITITQNTGVPGGAVTIRIHGQNSVSNGSEPLYVVDGVPYSSTLPGLGLASIIGNSGDLRNGAFSGSGGNALSLINPSDIYSIEILKDADATAIYGSRGANGVIVISTKSGKAGKLSLNVNFQKGIGQVPKMLKMLNTHEYLEMRKEAFFNDSLAAPTSFSPPNESNAPDLVLWDTTRYTNWQKHFIGGAADYTNVSIGLEGGSASTKILINGNYHREGTVFPGKYSDQKASLHFNISNTSLNRKFKSQLFGSYLADENHLPQGDFMSFIWMSPDAPELFEKNGELNWALNSNQQSSWINPHSNALKTYENKSSNLISNLNLEYEIASGLILKLPFGFNNVEVNEITSEPLTSVRPERRAITPRLAGYALRTAKTILTEPQISFTRKISNGEFSFLVGSTVQKTENNSQVIYASGFSDDILLRNISSATTTTAFATNTLYKYAGLFGRLNHVWKEKFILNATARRDGSSRFGKANKFHNFGAIGAGYIFSEENFFTKSIRFLSFGKLKASYGTVGSDQISDYQFLSLYSSTPQPSIPYQGTAGLSPLNIANPYLQWEEIRKLQMGIELGFFNNRLLFNSAYNKNRSSNQLLSYNLPSFVGTDAVTINLPATVQNINFESSVSARIIERKSLSWTTNFNITISRNKLISFPDLNLGQYGSNYIIGEPLSINRYYHSLGVDPASGLYQVADKNGKPTLSPNPIEDLTGVATTFPKFYGGFENSFQFGNLQLGLVLQFVKQRGIDESAVYNSTLSPGGFSRFTGNNQLVRVLDRWKAAGDVAEFQKYSTTALPEFFNAVLSDQVFTDASFIRCKNISISYLFSERLLSKLRLASAKVFLYGQNIFTVTKFTGFDPENQNLRALPALRIVTAGLQVSI